MKCYFDDLSKYTPNIYSQSGDGTGKGWWLIPNGTNLKQELLSIGAELDLVKNITTQGCYFLDVNGDPVWWAGYAGANQHALEFLPNNIIEQVKKFKLRIIITADREGGPMISYDRDCFQSTYNSIKKLGLPKNSVLITQGNKKIKKQYEDWLIKSNNEKLFDVMYINHFAHIFFDQNLPISPVIYESINNDKALDFNSLNRVYRDHRAAHLYYIAKNNTLNKGIVSANQITINREGPLQLLGMNFDQIKQFDKLLTDNYPKFIDGNWSTNNAANQYNVEIYKNSLVSFVTETQFTEDVVFLTEKIFKPIALGHPIIVQSSAGTLDGLKELGFRIDYLGINPEYNSISDNTTRLIETNKVLASWTNLPRLEKNKRIHHSLETIEHNFNLIRSKNFYHDGLISVLNKSKEYFNGLQKI